MSAYNDYHADYPAIDAEIARGLELEFGPYLGWTAYTLPGYLRALARKYPAPDLAYLHFRRYADAALGQAQS